METGFSCEVFITGNPVLIAGIPVRKTFIFMFSLQGWVCSDDIVKQGKNSIGKFFSSSRCFGVLSEVKILTNSELTMSHAARTTNGLEFCQIFDIMTVQ